MTDIYLCGDPVLRSLKMLSEHVYGHPRFGLVSVIELSCIAGEFDIVKEAAMQDMMICGWAEYELRYSSVQDRFLGICDRIERRDSYRIIYLLKKLKGHITAQAQGRR